MPEELTAENSRAPSGAIAKTTKVATWTTIIAAGLSATALMPVLVVPIAGVLAGVVVSAGSEVRNIQHTYEPGQRRAAEIQNPITEFAMNLIGKVL